VRVSFFLPGEADLERLRRLDPDHDWMELVRGERAWILQTYLRLARAGHPVDLVAAPPGEGLIVYHAKHERQLRRHGRRLGAAVLVGVRGDNREPLCADFQVLQNGVFVDHRSRFFVPSWPQPGLVPRDPRRGARVERIGFKGFVANLHPDFRPPAWQEALARRGREWVFDAVDFRGTATAEAALRWSDYHDVDLVLAVRPPSRGGHTNKPAAKLYNAWLAGVPALLGREPAYRELRESELDYLEVGSAAEALQAIDRLASDPGLYAAMVERGRERAPAFTPEALVPLWADLLWRRLPALAEDRPLRRLPLPLRRLLRRGRRILERRPAR
jgi:hypothetical protein